ncbi:MAG: YkgJ family cysteine cluster protein [Bullifex sp.]
MESLKTLEDAAAREWKKNKSTVMYLKTMVDGETVDEAFHELHQEFFKNHDCSSCRNCCRKFKGVFSQNELEKAAADLKLAPDEFMKKYLEDESTAKGLPCALLGKNGCILSEEARPEDCRDFPYTSGDDMVDRLNNVLELTSVCPPVLEMFRHVRSTVRRIEATKE